MDVIFGEWAGDRLPVEGDRGGAVDDGFIVRADGNRDFGRKDEFERCSSGYGGIFGVFVAGRAVGARIGIAGHVGVRQRQRDGVIQLAREHIELERAGECPQRRRGQQSFEGLPRAQHLPVTRVEVPRAIEIGEKELGGRRVTRIGLDLARGIWEMRPDLPRIQRQLVGVVRRCGVDRLAIQQHRLRDRSGFVKRHRLHIAGAPRHLAITIRLQLAGHVPVDRKAGSRAAAEVIRRFERVLEEGKPLLVFPEGTRSEDGIVRAFKNGGFYAALRAGVNGLAHAALIDAATASEMQRRGMFMIPTLASLTTGAPPDATNALQDGVAAARLGVAAQAVLAGRLDAGLLYHEVHVEAGGRLEQAGGGVTHAAVGGEGLVVVAHEAVDGGKLRGVGVLGRHRLGAGAGMTGAAGVVVAQVAVGLGRAVFICGGGRMAAGAADLLREEHLPAAVGVAGRLERAVHELGEVEFLLVFACRESFDYRLGHGVHFRWILGEQLAQLVTREGVGAGGFLECLGQGHADFPVVRVAEGGDEQRHDERPSAGHLRGQDQQLFVAQPSAAERTGCRDP